ncbi:hypothetical protein AWB68_01235 [Caballeronia choica]|jgi:hypothetical protein|uniref:Uncharacterized protein n=1 Tax=Caballeronia choica TaxID=326476 RepID=A0A158G3A3_9BURK|nr:hypothetical protein AWB68_01235 [Caballeronia choica]
MHTYKHEHENDPRVFFALDSAFSPVDNVLPCKAN